MPSTVATRPVLAPVSRASATASRSSGAHRRERAVRGDPHGQQDGALGEARGVVAAGGQHHPLGDLLGDGAVVGGGDGGGVDEREAVHGAIVPARRRSGHRPEG